MFPIKSVHYDARSLNPREGDTVTVIVQHHEQEPEELTAVFMGTVQMESYTTPYFRFLIGDQLRMICSNSIREWRYSIAAPSLQPKLQAPAEEEIEF